jgi:starch synthase (maltosyl-transferring)
MATRKPHPDHDAEAPRRPVQRTPDTRNRRRPGPRARADSGSPAHPRVPATAHGPESLEPTVAAGLRRVVVERVQPEIDAGRFPIKRTVGESVSVTVDAFADGHDLLAGVLKYRHRASARQAAGNERQTWTEVPLAPLGNDSWGASFLVTELGQYEYAVECWVDRFGTWLKGLVAKAGAGQDVASELLEGAHLLETAVALQPASAAGAPHGSTSPMVVAPPPGFEGTATGGVSGRDRTLDVEARGAQENVRLLELADVLRGSRPQADRVAVAQSLELGALMEARPDRRLSTTSARTLLVTVEPERARFSAWYEMFPRSCTPDPSRSGTFREAEARLPAVAAMGFDVLYLPPVHPIGRTHRKGPNNALTARPGDPGSPWAIGSDDGGHTAIEPGLGTFEDFDRFVNAANRLGLAVALDIAFQASPDHPWVRSHPEWFKHRPDGSIKYAENPPKKYQDIYPLDFESEAWASLWEELRQVFLFWISHGVTIFRVDNPHTKAFAFWEWCLARIKEEHPDTIFLSEAFTRPKVMRYLAKAGFTQSYTYFTWRNTAHELREYLTELTTTEVKEYMRPNFFTNTPDILHEYLQHGGRAAFEIRLVLAATLAASYGIYSGFELCENTPVRPGSEEYLDSEKYQIKVRHWHAPGNLTELIARVNEIRRAHVSLHQNDTLTFHLTDNPAVLWYSKTAGDDRVFVAVTTDPHWTQHGWVEMPIDALGIAPHSPYIVEDLLDGREYTWRDRWNYVKLDPAERTAHILVVKRG